MLRENDTIKASQLRCCYTNHSHHLPLDARRYLDSLRIIMANTQQVHSAQLKFIARAHRELNVSAFLGEGGPLGSRASIVEAVYQLLQDNFVTGFKKLLAYDAIVRYAFFSCKCQHGRNN